jgi:hypothetical protein
MKEVAFAAALAVALVAAVLALYRWGQRCAVSLVRSWADKNQFELLHLRERSLFESAPFPLFGSNRQPSHFVTVRDQQGKERRAWVRLGTLLHGISGFGKDNVEVKWEDDVQ